MPTLNTITAAKEVHRGTNNLNRLPLTTDETANLQRLVDAVLSFTAYYLRVEKANCRPSQLDALAALTNLNNELENQYGNTNVVPKLDGPTPSPGPAVGGDGIT